MDYFIGIEVLERMNRDTRMDAVNGSIPLDENNTLLDDLSKSDHGPFLLLFGLFVSGFMIFTVGMLLIVLGGYLALALFVLVPIVGIVVEAGERCAFKSHKDNSRGGIWNETENWVIMLGRCIPQKHREAIVGDILEDCHEMREGGLAERKIWTNALWQWVISVVALIPACIVGSIGRLFGAK